MSSTKPNDLLSTEQLAELLGVSSKAVRARGCGMSQLPVIRIGRLIRYRRQDVERWLEMNTREPFRIVQTRRQA